MKMQAYASYNGVDVNLEKYNGQVIINVVDLIKALGLSDKLKSARDTLRNKTIPSEEIVRIPISLTRTHYFLTRVGIAAFIDKFAPDQKESFLKWFDETVQEVMNIDEVLTLNPEKDKEVVTEKINKEDIDLEKISDSYAVDLLEDILKKVNEQNKDIQKLSRAFYYGNTKTLLFLTEMESLLTKGMAMLLRAETFGPIARTHKDINKELTTMSKQLLNDALSCDRAIQQFDEVFETMAEAKNVIDKAKKDQENIIDEFFTKLQNMKKEGTND